MVRIFGIHGKLILDFCFYIFSVANVSALKCHQCAGGGVCTSESDMGTLDDCKPNELTCTKIAVGEFKVSSFDYNYI